jgi:hypothetical protein
MKHEIIYTNYYALIVSDEEMVEGGYALLKKKDYFEIQKALPSCLKNAFRNAECWNAENRVHNSGHRKIIAHRPLTDAPILEGVPLLPEFGESDNVEKLAYNWFVTADKKDTIFDLGWVNIFTAGYKKSKETYKYTEDDLVAVWNIAFNEGMSLDDEINEPVSFKEVIKSLQQPKRFKYFETVCDCQECGANKTGLSLDMGCENKTATITNSQGQTELVGSYIF